jgi:hypothetical protein
MPSQHKYRIYPSLLDSFTGWVDSDRIYEEFWGFSENPSLTAEEFSEKQLQSLINSINRIPVPWEETEAMDRGTAFNEVVDCLIENRKSEKMELKSDKTVGTIAATYSNRTFVFPMALCREFASYFAGASTQVFVEATLPTRYGDVLLYGYADELLSFSCHDIKTSTRYSVGKYRNNWQHVVYPYCLNRMGIAISLFEYNVAQLSVSKTDGSIVKYETFSETYNYRPEVDDPRLTDVVERFIEFLEANRDKIDNKKIFNIQ